MENRRRERERETQRKTQQPSASTTNRFASAGAHIWALLHSIGVVPHRKLASEREIERECD